MAVINTSIVHAVDTVTLTGTATTITGVVLRRELEFSDIKIRPTNVTANIATEVNTPDYSANAIVSRQGLHTLGSSNYLVGGLITIRTSSTIDVDTGDEVRLSVAAAGLTSAQLEALTTGYAEGLIRSVSGDSISILIRGIVGTFVMPTGTQLISLVRIDHSDEHEPDFILMHNGPKGGFTQQITLPAGIYRVNGVVQKIITNG